MADIFFEKPLRNEAGIKIYRLKTFIPKTLLKVFGIFSFIGEKICTDKCLKFLVGFVFKFQISTTKIPLKYQ